MVIDSRERSIADSVLPGYPGFINKHLLHRKDAKVAKKSNLQKQLKRFAFFASLR
jgi:hypothetical protein